MPDDDRELAQESRPHVVARRAAALAVAAVALTLSTACVHRTPGEKLYRRHCAECHGIDGGGQTVRYMGRPEADLLDDTWAHGGGDPAILLAVLEDRVVSEHPDFSDLSDDQMRQIVKHLRKLRSQVR